MKPLFLVSTLFCMSALLPTVGASENTNAVPPVNPQGQPFPIRSATPAELQFRIRGFPLAGVAAFTKPSVIVAAPNLSEADEERIKNDVAAQVQERLEAYGMAFLKNTSEQQINNADIRCTIHFTDYAGKGIIGRWRIEVFTLMTNPRINQFQGMKVWFDQEDGMPEKASSISIDNILKIADKLGEDYKLANQKQ
jgi:hypothetical protein